MRERLEYGLAWAVLKILGILPRSAARWLAGAAAAWVFRIRPAWKQGALRNLQIAFPELEEAERRRVLRASLRKLGWLAAEFAHFPRYTRENIERVVALDGFENFAAAERRGKGVLFLTGHLGAWELCPVAHALYYQPLHFLIRPIDNPRVDALVNRYRSWCGSKPIPKNQSARAVLRVLKEGGVVGILADQNTRIEEAVFVDFFGVPAATSAGIARLARHSGAAVVPVYNYWDASLGKYCLHYEPALELPRTDDEEADIRAHTLRFNRALEDYIRRFPDQWLWAHRRWKNRPAGGKPVYHF